jgi:4-amino-4-deoxy-L-arabinose transferase-like glycosyltransferase
MSITRLVAESADKVCEEISSLCNSRFIYFDGIQIVGRFLSALADLTSILFVFLIGKRLYDWRVGLFASLLMAAAVLPIQQSHFFTMDNWAAALTTFSMYFAVRAAENSRTKRWWIFFGVGLGLAVASRINLAPLAVMAPVAAIVWLARRSQTSAGELGWRFVTTSQGITDLQRVIIGMLLAAILSIVTFRLAQPYAFADSQIVQETSLSETGQPAGTLRTIIGSVVALNPQWRANLEEIRNLQSPDASFPPALQWTARAPILFPLTNMLFWGMGLPAGLIAWFGFFWALWRIIRGHPEWTSHALLVAWVGIYFLFMATRWVKSIRYFLPIYPFLLLLGAWAIFELSCGPIHL